MRELFINLEISTVDDPVYERLYIVFQESVSAAFAACSQYAEALEPFRLFFQENEALDLTAIKEQDHGIYTKISN